MYHNVTALTRAKRYAHHIRSNHRSAGDCGSNYLRERHFFVNCRSAILETARYLWASRDIYALFNTRCHATYTARLKFIYLIIRSVNIKRVYESYAHLMVVYFNSIFSLTSASPVIAALLKSARINNHGRVY